MATIADVADRAQLTLNDAAAGTWPQATVEAWIADAMRDYSQYFPRVVESYVDALGGTPTHIILLPTDFMEMILVEFPRGEDPPAYLERRSMHAQTFWEVDGYYDIIPVEQEAVDGNTATQARLVLSRLPLATEGYTIRYLAAHSGSGSSDTVTVRSDHQPLLILYALWQAMKERAATHLQDPDTTSDILQKMVNAEMQAHEEYRRGINNAQQKRSQSGWTGPWKADGFDPIY